MSVCGLLVKMLMLTTLSGVLMSGLCRQVARQDDLTPILSRLTALSRLRIQWGSGLTGEVCLALTALQNLANLDLLGIDSIPDSRLASVSTLTRLDRLMLCDSLVSQQASTPCATRATFGT